MHIICAASGGQPENIFYGAVYYGSGCIFSMHHIGETPDKPKNVKSDNPAILPYGKTGVLAHRSGAGLTPENLLLAFQNMIKNRDKFELEGFELDLHLTKDGQIIVLHDDTLDRTSDLEEYFGKPGVLPCDLSFEELRKLNMGEKFVLPDGSIPYEGLRGDKIPDSLRIIRLSDVFDFLAPLRELHLYR